MSTQSKWFKKLGNVNLYAVKSLVDRANQGKQNKTLFPELKPPKNIVLEGIGRVSLRPQLNIRYYVRLTDRTSLLFYIDNQCDQMLEE